MERSELVAESLGEHRLRLLSAQQALEWEDYRHQVTAFELERLPPRLPTSPECAAPLGLNRADGENGRAQGGVLARLGFADPDRAARPIADKPRPALIDPLDESPFTDLGLLQAPRRRGDPDLPADARKCLMEALRPRPDQARGPGDLRTESCRALIAELEAGRRRPSCLFGGHRRPRSPR